MPSYAKARSKSAVGGLSPGAPRVTSDSAWSASKPYRQESCHSLRVTLLSSVVPRLGRQPDCRTGITASFGGAYHG